MQMPQFGDPSPSQSVPFTAATARSSACHVRGAVSTASPPAPLLLLPPSLPPSLRLLLPPSLLPPPLLLLLLPPPPAGVIRPRGARTSLRYHSSSALGSRSGGTSWMALYDSRALQYGTSTARRRYTYTLPHVWICMLGSPTGVLCMSGARTRVARCDSDHPEEPSTCSFPRGCCRTSNPTASSLKPPHPPQALPAVGTMLALPPWQHPAASAPPRYRHFSQCVGLRRRDGGR